METIAGRFVVDTSWAGHDGDMSRVVKAVDAQNGMKPVAVKLFDGDTFQQPMVSEAFARECDSLERLSSHENIVSLIDLGRDDESGCRYIALEWCDANLLEQVRREPALSWNDFYKRYGRDVLEALRFAYTQDVLHRDVKPQNVLIGPNGRACVTDFGISKFRRYYRPGVTLAHFKSTPYAPPEDAFESGETRDVFSFAVLCLECLGTKDFHTYEDVYAALEEIDLPLRIRGIFAQSLAKDPSERQQNIVLLTEEIAAEMAREATLAAITHEIGLEITGAAVVAMKAEGHLDTAAQAQRAIVESLNEVFAIEELADKQGGENHLALLTAEFRYRAVPDWSSNKLVIIRLSRQSPSYLERQREQAWQPLIRFTQAAIANARDELEWLMSEFAEFLTQRKVERDKLAETELFDRWAAILRFKDGLQKRNGEAIHYHGLSADGSRLRLRTREQVSEEIVGQKRLIRLADNQTLLGEVERVDGEEVIVYCGGGQNLASAPQHGALELDDRLAQTAFRRQLNALDAVKFGRSVRPDLRHLLTGKTPPRRPKPEAISFVQPDLDDDKKAAVAAALGTPDLLVVEGPPGTGKTKFITELVGQVLSADADRRVLISSQTHVALDHALTNIGKLAKEKGIPLRAVRIGRPDDERVSPGVEHLLLEKCVRSWLTDAMKRSEEFLINWATSRGISAENVRIGIALGDLRKAKLRLDDVVLRLKLMRREVDDLLQRKKDITKDKIKGDEYRALVADIRLKQSEIDELDGMLPLVRMMFADAMERARSFPDLDGQLDDLSAEDMSDLEEAFVSHAADGPTFRKMLALAEEWRQRFGQSADFHGAYVSDCDLVGGTCLGVATHALQSVDFDLCIVDEASKAAPTEILVPMAKSKRWVIVGDPNQLPPFADESSEARAELAQNDLTIDVIKRTLLDHFIEIAPAENKVSLTTQHRMTRAIGDLVSECFYQGRLKNVNDRTCKWLRKAAALPKPVTWINTAKLPNRLESSHRGTFVNPAEADAIANLLLRLELAARSRKEPYTVALLSGYGGQVASFERLVAAKRKALENLSVEVGTVDSYQGREADIAVYSVTRCNREGRIGFLREYERLNVALSRAKLGLAIVGDSVFCGGVREPNPFADVLSYMRKHPDDCAFVDLEP